MDGWMETEYMCTGLTVTSQTVLGTDVITCDQQMSMINSQISAHILSKNNNFLKL